MQGWKDQASEGGGWEKEGLPCTCSTRVASGQWPAWKALTIKMAFV